MPVCRLRETLDTASEMSWLLYGTRHREPTKIQRVFTDSPHMRAFASAPAMLNAPVTRTRVPAIVFRCWSMDHFVRGCGGAGRARRAAAQKDCPLWSGESGKWRSSAGDNFARFHEAQSAT